MRIADIGYGTVEDADWIDRDMHTDAQPPSPRWNEPPSRSLARTAVVKFQDREHGLRRLQQLAFYPQVPKGTEVRAHCVAAIKEWPEAALELRDHPVAGDLRRGRHGRPATGPDCT